MKKNPLLKTPSVLAIAAGALVAGMVFAFALEAFAFVGPTQAPPSGSGAIGSDSSNNVAVGTPTTISGDKFLSLGGTSDNTTYAGKFLENNTTPILLLRDDGAVSIATSTVTAGDTIIGDNLIVGGTLNASGLGASTISAGNVSSGQFGSGTGGGNYSFPGNIGIGTSTPSQPLVVSATGNEKLLLTGGSSQNGMVFDAADGADEFYLYGGASASNGFGIYDVTAGANRMEVLDNGDVGIGTASPSDALVVGTDVGAASGVPASTIMAANPGANSYVEVGQASTNRGRIMWDYNATPANAYMAVGVTNGTNSLVLQDSGGDVGIGTTSPAYLLDVAGTARATTLIDSGLTSQNCVGTNSGGQLIAGTCVVSAISAGNVSSGQFGSGTGGGNYSFPGSVGIGTTTPAYPLDVNGNIHTSVALLLGTSSNGAQLQNNPGTSVPGINTSLLGIAQQGVAWVYALDTSGDLGLAGGLNVHGDVGIGTTSPAYLLDVAGTARATTLIDSGLTSQNCVGTNSGGQLIAGTCVVSAISAGNVSSGQFGSNTGGGNYVFPVQINVGPTTGTNIGINGNQIWSLNNGGSSPLYINYSSTGNTLINENGGDVGIGTGSPGQALEVNGNIEVDGNYLYLGGGSGSVNGTGGPLIYGDLNNTVVKIGSGNGGLLLQNYAGTNVDDLAVSGNSYFNGGDVGIGTTSPGYKLTVTGGSNRGELWPYSELCILGCVWHGRRRRRNL